MTLVRRVEGNRRTALTGWQIAAASPGTPREAIDGLEWLPATVPGTAAGALRNAGRWDFSQTRDFDAEDFWWRCRFRTDPGNAVLGFDGLATLAEVWLDGELVLSSDNMFRSHEVPVTLRGEHELLVRCRALAPELARRRRPRPHWRVPMLEQQPLRWFRTTLLGRTPGWSPPCPAVGPWRPDVAGNTRARNRIRSGWIRGYPVSRAMFRSRPALDPRVEGANAGRRTRRPARRTPLTQQDGRWQGCAKIENPALWWPHTHGEPALYKCIAGTGPCRPRHQRRPRQYRLSHHRTRPRRRKRFPNPRQRRTRLLPGRVLDATRSRDPVGDARGCTAPRSRRRAKPA